MEDRFTYLVLETDEDILWAKLTETGRAFLRDARLQLERDQKRYWNEYRQVELRYFGQAIKSDKLREYRMHAKPQTTLAIFYWLFEEPEQCGWQMFSAHDISQIGAVTGNPYVIAKSTLNDDGSLDLDSFNELWFFPRYMEEDPIETLAQEGVVAFERSTR